MRSVTQPSEPRWHGDPDAWSENVLATMRMTDELCDSPLTLDRLSVEFPTYCDHGMAIATIVFYTAAHYNTLFSRPHPMILRTWAHLYGTHAHWMTVAVAEAAVHAHFATSTDGRMLPGHVIAEAKKLTGRDQ